MKVTKKEIASIQNRIKEIEGELAGLENCPSMAGRMPRMERLNAELKQLREKIA
jgi:prefoldin subunit 5